MSQENVEIVREGFEAFRRGDLEHAFSRLDEGIRWDGVPGAEPCRNRDEVEQNIRVNHEAGPLTEPEEFIDAGDKVVIDFRVTGELPEPYQGHERIYVVCTLRDGKVSRMHDYLDREEALEAAGLRE
jgi:ketosteroid isomerase-like protein